jgi:hypothetical protein
VSLAENLLLARNNVIIQEISLITLIEIIQVNEVWSREPNGWLSVIIRGKIIMHPIGSCTIDHMVMIIIVIVALMNALMIVPLSTLTIAKSIPTTIVTPIMIIVKLIPLLTMIVHPLSVKIGIHVTIVTPDIIHVTIVIINPGLILTHNNNSNSNIILLPIISTINGTPTAALKQIQDLPSDHEDHKDIDPRDVIIVHPTIIIIIVIVIITTVTILGKTNKRVSLIFIHSSKSVMSSIILLLLLLLFSVA